MPLASLPANSSRRGVVSAAFNILELAGLASLEDGGESAANPLSDGGEVSQEAVDDSREPTAMFWGVEVSSQSPMSVTAPRSIRISKAVLVAPADDHHSLAVELFLNSEPGGAPILISKFVPGVAESPLDLHIAKGDSLTFSTSPAGRVIVHLSGYYADEHEDVRAERLARADCRMEHLIDICNRILERTYHIN